MTPSEAALQNAIESASRAQIELDRRVFHLNALYATACELSELRQPQKIMETYVLTAMGLFGVASGLAILVNTRTGQGHLTYRGLSNPEAAACEQNLSGIIGRYLPEGHPSQHPERVISRQDGDPGPLPADTAVIVKQAVDPSFAVLAAFGRKHSGEPLAEPDITTLLNLTGTMAGALAHNLFNRQVEHLNAGLMRQSADLQNALRQAGQARENLDRRVFHIQALYELTAELSPFIATEKLIEMFLLTVMGTFGANAGLVLLCDRKRRRVCCVRRGGGPAGREWTLEEAEKCLYRGFQATADRRLAPMSAEFVVNPQGAFSESEMGFGVNTAVLFTVDDGLHGLAALGSSLGKPGLGAEEQELLRGLTANCMVFLKNARAFETIQALNEDLRRTNADLHQTIADLTAARDRIRLLEVAKSRLKHLIQREVERAGRLRLSDVLLVLLTSAVLALAFNFSSPNGIPLLPEVAFQVEAPRIDVLTAHQRLSRGEALLVDARPPELFEQKHLPDAINLPATLFDVLYPMKLGRMLKPEQTVLVYGRTISRWYDEDVAQRLLQRHEHVSVLEGGMRAWEEKGLPVEP
jgi:rhodanese-related sulfurtransferase